MAGYLGTKAVLLSTTAADVIGNAEIGGSLTVGGTFTSQGIDDNASATAMTLDASGNVGIGTSSPNTALTIINNNPYQLRLATTDNAYSSAGIFLGEDVSDPAYYGTIKWDQSATSMRISMRDGSNAGGLIFETGNSGSGPTERMRIDSSGTTTLQQTKAYGSETAVLRVRTITTGTNYSSGTFQNIVFGDETIVNAYFGQLAVVQENAAASTASTMRFYTNGGGGNAATQERMRIDSAGRVTTPYQPAFFATGSAGFHTTASGGVIPLAAVPLNVGNHYNTSGSKFTAPVSGSYQINLLAYMENTAQIVLKKNGADYIPTGGDTGFVLFTNSSTSQSASASGVVYLNAGDYIQMGARVNQTVVLYTGHSHFSGYLIG